MHFIQFLIDTPSVAFMLLLALLVTGVPLIAGFLSRRTRGNPSQISTLGKLSRETREKSSQISAPVNEPPGTRFLGIQMDIAILIVALLLLMGVIDWVRKAVFG